MRQTSKAARKPKVHEWIVHDPKRLDIFLSHQNEVKSRAQAQKAIKDGQVRINGKVVRKSSYQLEEGDKILFVHIEKQALGLDLKMKAVPLTVLYEDDACMVIDKPAGVAVHPGVGMTEADATILHSLEKIFRDRSLPFSPAETLVHRLDKDTTGCLLIAKTSKAHMELQKQFQGRTVKKEYLALVAGIPSSSQAMIDSPIGRHATERTKMSVMRMGPRSREARTIYRVLGSAQGVSLISCLLETGRTHQVRVHMQSIGHPVLGDSKYALPSSAKLSKQLGIDFLCLHAWKLTFLSPTDGATISVLSPLPDTFHNLLNRLGINLGQH